MPRRSRRGSAAIDGPPPEHDRATAEALLAWVGGQPNVGAAAKRYAGVKGDLDHFGALSFLQGLLVILRDSGFSGLVLVLDEVETLQRVRSDVREKSLNALRQVIDEIDSSRFPGLYLVITGTPAFFEGPQGVQRLPPLAQRLAVDFSGAHRFDNPRAPQVRLQNVDLPRLEAVGRKIRDLYAEGAAARGRILERADDAYLSTLARAVTGGLGWRVGIAPRVFLKKLVQDVLDRIDLHPDFDSAARLRPHPRGRRADRRRAQRACRDHAGRRRAGTVSHESRSVTQAPARWDSAMQRGSIDDAPLQNTELVGVPQAGGGGDRAGHGAERGGNGGQNFHVDSLLPGTLLETAQLTVPLRLGEMGETPSVLSRHWFSRFERLAGPLTVARLREALDQRPAARYRASKTSARPSRTLGGVARARRSDAPPRHERRFGVHAGAARHRERPTLRENRRPRHCRLVRTPNAGKPAAGVEAVNRES